MKKLSYLFVIILLTAGAFAMYILPMLGSEPVLSFQLGLGAVIFAACYLAALLLLTGMAAFSSGAERADRRVNRERDDAYRQFLRRLDHELKNPLTGLQAALTNLRESRSSEDTRSAVENASQAATRLGRILRDLRKLAELDAGMLEHRPVDVDDLVNEMVSAAGSLPAYKDRRIQVLISKIPALPTITGDRDMLGLAVFNLLDNALKYSSAADAVEIRVREDGRTLFIEAADSGAGIPPEEHALIFDDLYRGGSARETEGSGLGLALARRIVQLHGGEISVRSDPAQVRGTVFTIQLPVS